MVKGGDEGRRADGGDRLHCPLSTAVDTATDDKFLFINNNYYLLGTLV